MSRSSTRKPPFYHQGQTIGRWTVVSGPHKNRHGHFTWLCKCVCGIQKIVLQTTLRNGESNSCGCLRAELVAKKNTTHGQAGSPEHRRWKGMIDRCTNPNNKCYRHYGGRGIRVCDRWRESFAAFLEDMGAMPGPRHEIDRHPNNDGNYKPGNCRWAVRKDNCRNKRNNRVLEDGGVRQTLSEWAERLGAPASVVWQRMHRLGWSVHDAVTLPVRRR